MKFLFDVCASSRALRTLLSDLGMMSFLPLSEILVRRTKHYLPWRCKRPECL